MNLNAYVWLGLAVLFLVVEAGTVALVSVWFAGGALLAMLAAILGAGFALQLAVFVLASGGLLALMYPYVKKRVNSRRTRTNADRLIGQQALVTEDIDNLQETGAIRINGVLWTAKSDSGARIPAGAQIRILRIEGAKVYVEPV